MCIEITFKRNNRMYNSRNKLKTPIWQITLLMGMLFIWKKKDFVNSSYITFIPFKTNDSRLNLYVKKKTRKQINSLSFLK